MTQKISVQFFDPADAKEVNAMMLGVREPGIYSGAYLTKVSDIQVSISIFTAVITSSNNDYQVKCTTDAVELSSASIANPYIIMRWTYADSPSAFATFTNTNLIALASFPNALVIGKCVYTGSIMTGFDYSLRTIPNTHELFLKVRPTAPASMNVRIAPGKISYGVKNYSIIDQVSPVFVAPTANPRIDVLYVDTDGIVRVYMGAEAATPVAPLYNGKQVLAQITLVVGQTSIVASDITDVRAFLSGGGYAIYAP